MKAVLGGPAILVAAVIAWALALSGCDYARMTTDEAYDLHETRLPPMPDGSVSVQGNITAYRLLGPEALTDPAPPSPAAVARGRLVYGYFCDHCHGPRGNGHGTVGQSFAPLPTDLGGLRVLGLSDGELYYRIGYGFRRHPALAHTMLEPDIWAVIRFMRSGMLQEDGQPDPGGAGSRSPTGRR